MITKWNTGRVYSAHGQRMIAEQMEDGRVRFVDRDRGIYGVIAAPSNVTLLPKDPSSLQRRTMHKYDANEYSPDWRNDWVLAHLD